MATLNDVCSLAAILSDLCDDTDTDLCYVLSVPKHYCTCVANNMSFNSTLTIWMAPSCELTVLALDLEGVHDLKLHHPSSSVATSNQ